MYIACDCALDFCEYDMPDEAGCWLWHVLCSLGPQSKKPRCGKGYYASNTAYLLVYHRNDGNEKEKGVRELPVAPVHLLRDVEEENRVMHIKLANAKKLQVGDW